MFRNPVKKLLNSLVRPGIALTVLGACTGVQAGEQKMTYPYDSLKPLSDQRKFRTFVLENNLRVLLISSPHRSKASAVMDVGVGSLAEPGEFQGMAHFLEHLLFLGTTKYPETDGYKKLIDKYQGADNAYTSREHTNYHFAVLHGGFSESLERFSWFFKDPSFHPEYVDKERKAVHDEASMLKSSDDWRQMILFSRLLKPDHPFHNYHPGDLGTLEKISRDDVKRFYETHYSASDMNLVLDSAFSLDKMEEWVREKFSGIPDRGIRRQEYSREIFAEDALPQLIKIRPLTEQRSLSLSFFTDSHDSDWRSRPGHIASHFLGHEGEGSLLASLKQDNLATGLSAGLNELSFVSSIDLHIDLTPKGLKQIHEVISRVYSYAHMLRNAGLPYTLWREIRNIAETEFLYSDPNDSDGLRNAMNLAVKMHKVPALAIEQRSSLYYSYDPGAYLEVLEDINPSNMIAFVTDPEARPSLKEKDFGTPYEIMNPGTKYLKIWNNPRTHPGLTLPKPNPYAPDPKKFKTPTLTDPSPLKIADPERGTLWFQEDHQTGLPKATVRLEFVRPVPQNRASDKVLTDLYMLALHDSLTGWQYSLLLAGLELSIEPTEKGLEILISGYSDKVPAILKDLPSCLTTVSASPKKLSQYKQTLKERYLNFYKLQPYEQLQYELSRLYSADKAHIREIMTPDQKTDLISLVDSEAFLKFVSGFYASVALEGTVFGPVDRDEITEITKDMLKSLGSRPLAPELRRTVSSLQLSRPLKKDLSTEMDNHSWGRLYQMGARSTRSDAAIRIAMAFLEQHYFNSLRTTQKLGYIVDASRYNTQDYLGVLLLVQSSSHSPEQIQEASETWLREALQDFANLSPEEFSSYVQAVSAEVARPPKGLSELFQHLDTGAWLLRGNFNYYQDVAKATKDLSQKEVSEFLTKYLLSEPVSITSGLQSETALSHSLKPAQES